MFWEVVLNMVCAFGSLRSPLSPAGGSSDRGRTQGLEPPRRETGRDGETDPAAASYKLSLPCIVKRDHPSAPAHSGTKERPPQVLKGRRAIHKLTRAHLAETTFSSLRFKIAIPLGQRGRCRSHKLSRERKTNFCTKV